MNVREWALPVFTILMQVAVGALFVLWLTRAIIGSRLNPSQMDRIIRNPVLVIFLTTVAAMISSHFHLSRPFHSFLAVLNFKSSWLSREIVFTLLFLLTTLLLCYLINFESDRRKLAWGLGWLANLFGGIVVYCMVRIYLLPTQVAWNSSAMMFSFYVTTLLLGIMTIACLMMLDLKFAEIKNAWDVGLRTQVIKYSFGWFSTFAFILVIASVIVTYFQIEYLRQGDIAARTSLRLLFDLYLPIFFMRLILLVAAASWMGHTAIQLYRRGAAPQGLIVPVYMSCLLILVAEIIGRFLFYATHVRVGI